MRAIRDGMVLSPPLIIDEAEIDEIVAKAARAFDLTLADLAE
jgi:putrescine---pyruvate transaminase